MAVATVGDEWWLVVASRPVGVNAIGTVTRHRLDGGECSAAVQ